MALLEANRVTQNKIELRVTTLDLCAAVREAAEAVRDSMPSREQQLDVEIPSQPPIRRASSRSS